MDPALPKNIVAAISLGNQTTTYETLSNSTTRNCLFDIKFDSISCKGVADHGTIKIKFTGTQSFQETLPIICGTAEETQKPNIDKSIILKKDNEQTDDQSPANDGKKII